MYSLCIPAIRFHIALTGKLADDNDQSAYSRIPRKLPAQGLVLLFATIALPFTVY